MPELPEVQTVLDTLALRIKDKEILDLDIKYKNIIVGNPTTFKKKLIGQHFRQFKRRGKYLLFEMDDFTLVSHLRMEGKYFIYTEKAELSKHDHIIFKLSDGIELRYNDVRKFGRMEIIEKGDYKEFKDLGVEPFSDDFTLDYCKNKLSKNKMPMKSVLLDQSFIAGIGNIYADEILFAIKCHPLTIASKLDEKDYKNLIKYTRKILEKAIEAGGTTIRSYTSSLGVTGRFQLSLKVHTMEKCPVCKKDICKIRVGGRGTFYCEDCQKLK